LGIVLSTVAGVTDYLDGYIARRTGQVTRLGEILDQFCDLCFESFLIVMATAQGFFPRWSSACPPARVLGASCGGSWQRRT